MREPLVDFSSRTVSSRVFADPEVFAREQAAVFGRSWLYVGHTSQLARPGDFIQSYAGTLPLIVSRGEGDAFYAVANVCVHRGARLCQEEKGNTQRFVCPYHAWVFDPQGNLVGFPRRSPEAFDKSKWGLVRADRVETYRGLIFATFSPAAPTLAEHLGEMAWYLDLLLATSAGGTEVYGTHRSVVHCNWKVAAENSGGDNWHFQAAHGSMAKLGRRNEAPESPDSFHARMPQGHMLICVAPKREYKSAFSFYLDELLSRGEMTLEQRRLLRCSLVFTVFPNLSLVYFPGMCTLRVWHPRSTERTELWSWALAHRGAPEHIKAGLKRQVIQNFSPSGILEQDDLEVWARVGENLREIRPGYRLCYAFGAGEEGPPRPYPGITSSLQSDTPAFFFYARWAELLAAGEAVDAR